MTGLSNSSEHYLACTDSHSGGDLGGEKSVKVTGATSDGELWVSKILLEVVDLARDSKHLIRLGLTEEESQEELSLMDRALAIIERLQAVCTTDQSTDAADFRPQVKESRNEAGRGAELFLAATLLHHCLSDERGNDDEIVEVSFTFKFLFSI